MMRGIADSSDPSEWTHLIPGLIVAGLGIGLINVPLASTAVGVVSPERSGMASGVNSTFRQVGIATGIAALGSIFAHQVADGISGSLAGTPAAGRTDAVANAVTNGQIHAVISHAPASVRQGLEQAATSSFVDALNHIVTISASSRGGGCALPVPHQGARLPGSPRPGASRRREGHRSQAPLPLPEAACVTAARAIQGMIAA